MQWRFAEPQDFEELARLNHQLIADEGHRNPMSVTELEQRMASWLRAEYRAVVFESAAEIVAYALYRDDEAGRVHLRQFFVVRHLRRRGIGREALRIFRTAVAPAGKRIVLEVLTSNEQGRAFWIANGFQEYAITLERPPDAEG
jgi:ribosomal protein S18 acetylase RimI-like enzyme